MSLDVTARRLTGSNLYSPRPGAVLQVEVDDTSADGTIARWRTIVQQLLLGVGWPDQGVVVRRWPGGAGLFVSAPVDGLLAATEVNEQAWLRAVGRSVPPPPLHDTIARLQVHVQHERNVALLALAHEARARDLAFSFDDDVAAVGSGAGVRAWPITRIPAPDAVDWSTVHNVPVALVTGSNGKTTTVRVLAAMLRAAGHTVGHTCTDGVYVNGDRVASGDWSGPAGARRVLHDPAVTAAVLETARGGMLRRGLATTRADVAVVTRVAPDHYGEYGIHDLASLGDCKAVVARALPPGAPLVLNADDDTLVHWSRGYAGSVIWCSLNDPSPLVHDHVHAGGSACVLRNDVITLLNGSTTTPVVPATQCPIALGGRARYNVANLLGATAAAQAMHVPVARIREVLCTFGLSRGDNPGRLQIFTYNAAMVVVDFVHNPDGWRALYEAVRPSAGAAGRTIVTLGQAGDRDDSAIRELVDAVLSGGPDLVVLKEMESYLRGRPLGQTAQLLADALHDRGFPASAVHTAHTDLDAVRVALDHARPGDLVVLAVHNQYADVIDLLSRA